MPVHLPPPRLRFAAAALAAGVALVLGCSDSVVTDSTGGTEPSASVITAPATTATEVTEPDQPEDTSDATTDDDGAGAETSAPDTSAADDGAWLSTAYALVPIGRVSEPMTLVAHPDDDDLWVAERAGRVRRLVTTPGDGGGTTYQLDETPILDITDRVTTTGEGGLLSIAFSPTGEHLYAHYTDLDGNSQVAVWPFTADGPIDAGAEQILLAVRQPFSNHNGADVVFGPDGLLYIALGDGGAADDPENNGQRPETLLGSILRIDPDPDGGDYAIPEANPFADDPDARPEVLYWGLRNPFRISFDPETGDLWVPDVGQNRFEEINVAAAADRNEALNFGWSILEGFEARGEEPTTHQLPVLAYGHDENRCSITGGHVYRGPTVAPLDGVFLFSDFCRGGLNGVTLADDGTVTEGALTIDRQPINVTAFGRDADNELYVLEQGGDILRLTTASDAELFGPAS